MTDPLVLDLETGKIKMAQLRALELVEKGFKEKFDPTWQSANRIEVGSHDISPAPGSDPETLDMIVDVTHDRVRFDRFMSPKQEFDLVSLQQGGAYVEHFKESCLSAGRIIALQANKKLPAGTENKKIYVLGPLTVYIEVTAWVVTTFAYASFGFHAK